MLATPRPSEMRRRPRSHLVAAILVLSGLALGGCAGGHRGRTVDRAALDRTAIASLRDVAPRHRLFVDVVDGAYAFRQKALKAAAGRISITLRNPTGVWHDVMVVDVSRRGPQAWPYLGHQPITPATGADRLATDTTDVTLRPGRYRLICNIIGHAANGMSIPLEVVDAPGATDRPLPDTAEQVAERLPSRRVTVVRAGRAARWAERALSVSAGRIGFRLVNRSSVPTNLIVLAPDGNLITPDAPLTGHGRAGFVLDLARGEYQLTNLAAGGTMTIPLHVR